MGYEINTKTMNNTNYKELLKNAPDHLSDDFTIYLMNNNKVVALLDNWLVIENYKYHSEERLWWTAFYRGRPGIGNEMEGFLEMMQFLPDGMAIFRNPEKERTVKRTHYHITPMSTPK